ncbi:RNA polymerase II-associated protein 1-like isoform X2 [Ornithodoros turicata]|uniref:RNA polymerase II-associated protein 1-like isoform X2 n=1 Tax=Ornithodoros turicata TaxID=34597 RepID=UPI003139AF16
MDLKRPRRGETDEELLRMQEAFLQSKEKPSAAVYRVQRPKEERTASPARLKKKTKMKLESTTHDKVVFEETFPAFLLGDIVEHDVCAAPQFPTVTDVPFPKAQRRNVHNLPSKSSKSIFAMQMESRKEVEKCSMSTFKSGETSKMGHVGTRKGDLRDDEYKRLQEENQTRLESMSHEEKMEAQKQLLQQLDPALVSFLRSRQKAAEQGVPGSGNKDETGSEGYEAQAGTEESKSTAAYTAVPECIEEAPTAPLELNDAELPIDPLEARQWVHMDVVEKDKLAWMTLLPQPRPPDTKIPHLGRFDFEGNLVPPDADIPTQRGLHHHGQQPEHAGYTVVELFTFLRSSVQSQRIVALQTLEKMLQKHWLGIYDECLTQPLLPQLVDGGALPLLRSSLDDKSETTVSAAVRALRAFLVSSPDEVCLDRSFVWHGGHVAPFIQPGEIAAPLKEIPDDDLAKMDAVQGLLRMDVLLRLRYVLEVLRPDAAAVVAALEVQIRIARHSLEAATKVYECPRLMSTIFEEFLPPRWGCAMFAQGKMAKAHGMPLWIALKLVRIVASAGRHLAARMIQDYPLLESLQQYIAIDTSDGKIPLEDCLHLAIESLRTWKVFLSYGLGTQIFTSMFPVIMRQLQYCCTLSVIGTGVAKHTFDYEYGACLLSCLRSIVHFAALSSSRPLECEVATWNQVKGLTGVVETCFFHWVSEISHDETNWAGLALLGSAMDFLADYYKRHSEETDMDPVPLLGQIETVCNRGLCPLLQSHKFQKLTERLRQSSSLLCSRKLGSERDSPSLPSLGAVLWTGGATPAVCEESPFHLLTSLTHLMVTCVSLHRGMGQVCQLLLCHSNMKAYLQDFLQSTKLNYLHWFSNLEATFVCSLVRISALEIPSGLTTLYHEVSLALLCVLTPGKEDNLISLLQNVVFHPDLLSDGEGQLHTALASMDLRSGPVWQSASGDALNLAPAELLSLAQKSLPRIKETYVDEMRQKFGSQVSASRMRNEEAVFSVDCLSIRVASQALLHSDWMYLPIEHFYQEHKTNLCWTHFLFVHRKSVTSLVPSVIHYCHLASTFLTGSGLFLDLGVQRHLLATLRLLLSWHVSFDFNYKDWPGLPCFVDFYTELVEHYAGVSYGDKLFSNFVLIPVQARYDAYFRKFFFAENLEAVRITSLNLHELLLPVKNFLDPPESDESMLSIYFRCIRSGQVDPKRTPLLHSIAVHHVSSYIHSQHSSTLKCDILKQLSTQRDKDWAMQVLDYR